jgi:hypothetical protein
MLEPGPEVLEEPVWYAPLRSPAWFLPPIRPGAPNVVFTAPAADDDDPDRAVRRGLPMYLAEAVRFTTDAQAATSFAGASLLRPSTVRADVVLAGAADDRSAIVTLEGPADHSVVERGAVGIDGLETALAALPGTLTAALRAFGIRSVWSAVWASPVQGYALRQVCAHEMCRWLGDPANCVPRPEETPEETRDRRQAVLGALRPLSGLAQRVASPFTAFLFFAGLAAARDAGSGLHLEFRLPANAMCMNATDPRDPVFRLSVLVFRLLGDPVIASQRARAIVTDDPDLRHWLTRTEAVT